MVTLHPNIRRWSTVKVGYGPQVAQGTPLATLPKWIWADDFALGKDPQFHEFAGAFGGVHFPRDANVLTHHRPRGSFQAAVTKTLLADLLPWVTQDVVGSWSPSIQTYWTVAIRDDVNGRDIRVADAVPLDLVLESSIATQGFLLSRVNFFGEDYDDEAAGAFVYTEATPADKKKYLHNPLVVTNLDTGEPIGVSRVTLRFPSGFFPWDHNSEFPLARKDGPMNIEGEIESAFSDTTDRLRRNAEGQTYAALRIKYTSQAAVPSVLTIDLNDCILTDPPDTGYANKVYSVYRGRLKNYGVPVLTLT